MNKNSFSFNKNSIPVIILIILVIVFTIVQQLKVPVFESTINPWSFTTHMLGWKGFFYVEKTAEGATIRGSVENPAALVRSGLVLVSYIILFLGISIRTFSRKDILS